MNGVYYEWNDIDFKVKMRLKRKTFNVILEKVFPQIELITTNVRPNPTSAHHHIYSSHIIINNLQIRSRWHLFKTGRCF